MHRHSVDDPIQPQAPPARVISADSLRRSVGLAGRTPSNNIHNVYTGPTDPILWSILDANRHLQGTSEHDDDTNGDPQPQRQDQLQALTVMWGDIRGWLRNPNNNNNNTSAAAAALTYRDRDDATVLHLLCQYPDVPADVIEDIVMIVPYVAGYDDSIGYIPLHYACATVHSLEVLQLLVEAYPQGITAQDRHQVVPLHRYFLRKRTRQQEESSSQQRLSTSIVSVLSRQGAAMAQDINGVTPFHYACRLGAPIEELQALLEVCPHAIRCQDFRGRLPIHFAVYSESHNAVQVFEFLLQKGGARQLAHYDNSGNLPLHYLLENYRRASEQGQLNRKHIMLRYLDCDCDDVPDAEYFSALRDMPVELQQEALWNPGRLLQRELNKEIAKPAPTMILMLDFYFLIALIASYQLAVAETIQCLYDNRPTTAKYIPCLAIMMATGIYFSLRELTQMVSFTRLKIFWSGWVLDGTNFADVTSVVLIFFWVGFMWIHCAGDDTRPLVDSLDEKTRDIYRNGMALTAGVFWLNLLLFLRTTSVDFAVFVGGVFHVLRGLTAFLTSLMMVLIAFAQVFYNVSQGTELCARRNDTSFDMDVNDIDDGVSFCEFKQSMLHVYYMLLGQIAPGDFEATMVTTWVYCAFMFLAVVLLANILIAIVTESYVELRDEKSSQVFWSNRFAFLVEVESIENITKLGSYVTRNRRRRDSDGNDNNNNGAAANGNIPEAAAPGNAAGNNLASPGAGRRAGRLSLAPLTRVGSGVFILLNDERKYTLFERLWNFLTGLDIRKWGLIEIPFNLLAIISILIFLFLWIVVGAATAGLLWPPQIRRYLLHQTPVVNKHRSAGGGGRVTIADRVRGTASAGAAAATNSVSDYDVHLTNQKLQEEVQDVKKEIQELKDSFQKQQLLTEARINEQLETIVRLVSPSSASVSSSQQGQNR